MTVASEAPRRTSCNDVQRQHHWRRSRIADTAETQPLEGRLRFAELSVLLSHGIPRSVLGISLHVYRCWYQRLPFRGDVVRRDLAVVKPSYGPDDATAAGDTLDTRLSARLQFRKIL